MKFLLLFAFLGFSSLSFADAEIAQGVTVSDIESDLPSRRDKHLREMTIAPEKRQSYVRDLYFLTHLNKEVESLGLDKGQEILEALRVAKKKIYLEALVKLELEKNKVDMYELAKERYEANITEYRRPERVILALIFMKKIGNEKEDAKTRKKMEEIYAQLTADLEEQKKALEEAKKRLEAMPEGEEKKLEAPQDTLFFELAKQYSQDRNAKNGGINRKFILAPKDLSKAPKIVQAVFAMNEVGEITDLIENSQGFSIFKLIKKEPAITMPFEAVEKQIMHEIGQEIWDYKKAEVERRLLADEFLEIDDKRVLELVKQEQAKRSQQKQDSGSKQK